METQIQTAPKQTPIAKRRCEPDRVCRMGAHPTGGGCRSEEHDRRRQHERDRLRQVPERGRADSPHGGMDEMQRPQQAIARPEHED